MKFLSKIFSPVILIISIFLLLYTFYKSEFHWDGQIRGYYYKYYLISSILIIISIVTFILSKKVKEYIIISSFSLIFSLYSLEIYFSFNPKLSKEQLIKEKIYKEQTGIKWDGRTKYEIYNDLKKLDDRITITLYPNNHVKENYSIFPLSGISDAKTINCNENGFYSTYLSDRYGFNNPNHVWDSKEIEYLLVGDSYVHGFCVNRPNDIASVLRNLSNKSVLNLGYGGIGPLIEYAILREYIRPGVKNILWFYYENSDLMDLESNLKKPILKKYLESENFSQNLVKKQKIVDNLAKKELQRINSNHNKTSQFLKLYKLRTLLSNIFNRRNNVELQPEFIEILEKAKKLSIKNNSKLVIITTPVYNSKLRSLQPQYSKVMETIRETLQSDSFCDLSKNETKEILKNIKSEWWNKYPALMLLAIFGSIHLMTKFL